MYLVSSIRAWLLLGLVALLAACAGPQQSFVNLPKDYFTTGQGTIGVAMTAVPKPDTFFPGADCLLCLATASMVNRSLTDTVQKWPTNDLDSLKEEVAAMLRAQGQTVVVIADPVKVDDLPKRTTVEDGFSQKDFSSIKTSAKVDRLLVIDHRRLGAVRNYSAYIPTGAPRATFEANAYIVDLATHKLQWYEMVRLDRSATGTWDEPPKYPGLTNAYFATLEEAKDAIKKPFVK